MNQPTISDMAGQIHNGRITPPELAEQCLGRIAEHEDRIHAWVLVDEEGARRTAEELAAEDVPRGPLHGIPLGIKDIVDVRGFATRAGSPLRERHIAEEDAPVVAALRRAAAIILGKTVTVEFACFDPSPTKNPWSPDLTHTPGGSSSGSAAAVALGMCFGAIGSQTGGSLVRPATYCGVATCKPTFGRISRRGVVPVSYHLDHVGPMARSAGDLEIMLRCLMDKPSSSRPPLPDPPRLGLLEQFFMEEASRGIHKTTTEALDRLRNAGAQVQTVAFPDGFEQVRPMHRRIMAVEAAAYHREPFAKHREAYGPMIASLLDEGLTISGVDYAAALAWQRGYRRRVTDWLARLDIDALIVPSTDTTAPATLETTGTPKFQAPWSSAGLPVVSIPCGLARCDSADVDMPAAVQLVGPADSEFHLLRVARWCQQRLESLDRLPISP